MENIIGSIAAVLTTFSFLPQVIKIIKTSNTENISLLMYILAVIGQILWLAYGIIIGSFPIIISNTLTLIFSSIILYVKITHTVRPNTKKMIGH
ncbi:MAG: glutathione synthetase [Rickettsiaceae bacterium]|jgi:MtN3 and saliva related transmembrane protein|nr:glutathione synthetase [Rickettsiaceae bacterium]